MNMQMALAGDLQLAHTDRLFHAIDILYAGIDCWQSLQGIQPSEGTFSDLLRFPDHGGTDLLEAFGRRSAQPDRRER